MKSGTNAIHGDVFAIYRDAFFDAAGAFNDVNGNNAGVIGAPNADHEINWGFTAGGPVLLPKLYHGKDRTFFFVSFQRTPIRQLPTATFVTLPTVAQRNGDLSAIRRALSEFSIACCKWRRSLS